MNITEIKNGTLVKTYGNDHFLLLVNLLCIQYLKTIMKIKI